MGNTSSASTGPADMKAAVKQLDHERKRLLHVSKSLHAQEEYINQLEDLTKNLRECLNREAACNNFLEGLENKYVRKPR